MRETPKQLREQAAVLTCRLFDELYGDQDAHKACLYWADTFMEVAAYVGIKTLPQAGTAIWQVNDGLASDQEVNAFSYVFHPMAPLITGLATMPEMHCWCVVPTKEATTKARVEYEIVDMSTGYQEQQSLEMGHRIRWQFPPPEYIWMAESRLATFCMMRRLRYEYHADVMACHLMRKYIELVRARDRITYMAPSAILKASASGWLQDAALPALSVNHGAQG